MDEIERKRAADRERQRAHRARKAQAEMGEREKMLRARLALLDAASAAIGALPWDYEGEQPLGTYALGMGELAPDTWDKIDEAAEAIRNELDPGRATND